MAVGMHSVTINGFFSVRYGATEKWHEELTTAKEVEALSSALANSADDCMLMATMDQVHLTMNGDGQIVPLETLTPEWPDQ